MMVLLLLLGGVVVTLLSRGLLWGGHVKLDMIDITHPIEVQVPYSFLYRFPAAYNKIR
jgi:hypothetical protein